MRSAVLARWSCARQTWGAAEPRESPASLWYSRQAVAQGVHVVQQNLSLAQTVAQASLSMPQVELPRHSEAEAQTAQRLAQKGIRDFAIVNPGAGWGAKRWPAERYGQVARRLAEDGISSILNYGPGEDKLAHAAEAASEGTARAMNCSITELIALT